MEIYSFSVTDRLPHRLIRLTTTHSWVRLHHFAFRTRPPESCSLLRVLENHSGNKMWIYSYPHTTHCLFSAQISPSGTSIFLPIHSVIMQWEACFLPQYGIFVFQPPPNPPLQISVVRVRTLVITYIPGSKTLKYFSTKALTYRYVYTLNMPLLLLHCRQRSGRQMCRQINRLQIFIRWAAHRALLTLPAGLNSKTRMMLLSWHAGSLHYNTAMLRSHSFTQLFRFMASSLQKYLV